MKKIIALLLCLTSLSSCYSVTLQSNYDDSVPVMLNESVPEAGYTTRHFSHRFNQWYVFSLLPYDIWNNMSEESRGLVMNQYIDFVLQKEAENAVAVKNIKITTAHTAEGWLYGVLVGFIPAVGPFINNNITIIVEGDVVEPA